MPSVASISAWLVVGAALSGCAAGTTSTTARPGVTTSGMFVSADGGAARIAFDTLGDTLEAEEEVTPVFKLGLGYQANRFAAVEVRAGDIGTLEFTDGRELSYRVADVSGLVSWHERNASVFARLGVGTFANDGDFDVQLESPVHAVIGGGVSVRLNPQLDLRASLTAHGSDAVVGSAGLVWRIGGRGASGPKLRSSTPSEPSFTASTAPEDDDGFQPIAPVDTESLQTGRIETQSPTSIDRAPVNSLPDADARVAPAPSANSTTRDPDAAFNGLVIDEKPEPVLVTVPEPVVPEAVAESVQAEQMNLRENRSEVASTAPAPAPAPQAQSTSAAEPEPEPVSKAAGSGEELFVVDTLLNVEPLQFSQGEASLVERSISDLDEVADLLALNPTLRLLVESHAAPVGDAELNMLLSRRRALTVIRSLVKRGINPTRLRPRAFGDTAPLADALSINDNDRVEFRVR